MIKNQAIAIDQLAKKVVKLEENVIVLAQARDTNEPAPLKEDNSIYAEKVAITNQVVNDIKVEFVELKDALLKQIPDLLDKEEVCNLFLLIISDCIKT